MSNRFGFEQPEMIGAQEVSRKLGISLNATYKAAHLGQLPSVKVGGRMLFPRVLIEGLCAGTWRPEDIPEQPVIVGEKQEPA